MHAQTGRYLILKKIAVGGMAEIFLARRVSLGDFSKFVVIKRLAPEYQGKRSFEQLFLNEARLTARLAHPNIVQVHDIGLNDGAYYMAMEYIHGITAAELMSRAAQQRRPVPLGVALGVALATARALEYCSQALNYEGESLDILHHDVSPHNIQIRYDGEVKLLDFGVATQAKRESTASRRGKFAYMSPEAYHRMPLDSRSDMFSLGVVLYELTMGRRLFKGKSQEETRQRAEQCVIPKPTEIHARFPESLEALVLKALAKDRDERFTDFTELRLEMERTARHLKLDVSSQRVARYLQELYGEMIEERTLRLQGLSARAEAMRDQTLDEISVIRSREKEPVVLEELERAQNDEHEQGVISLSITPPPHSLTEPMFGAESIEGELAEELEADEALNTPDQQHAPGQPPRLPPDFTAVAQREDDWDVPPQPAQRSGPSIGSILLVALVASVVAFFAGQQLSDQVPWAQPKPATLEVRTTPPNVKVLLNGVPIGATPISGYELEVKASEIELQVIDSRFKTVRRVFAVEPGQAIQLDLQLSPQ